MSLTNKLIHALRLKDLLTGKDKPGDGGQVIVCPAGLLSRASLFDPDNGLAALAQPVSFVGGELKFAVDGAIISVDIYGVTPDGHAFQLFGVKAQQFTEIAVNSNLRHHTLVIPFDHADFPANTETDTGFDEPANAFWLPTPFVDVVDVDATETIDVGTEGSGSNDPNGFLAGVSVATAGIIKGTLLEAGQTLGALLSVAESATDLVPEGSASTGDNITATLSAGSDTASGRIYLPYMLAE